MKGFFGDMFDFDHDGDLNLREAATDFLVFSKMAGIDEEHDDPDFDDLDDDDFDDDLDF